MTLSIDAYPLQWPEGWRRSRHRGSSRYQVSLAQARDSLLQHLRLLGAVDVVISTNLPTRRDGLPMSRASEPADPGVAVYWITQAHGTSVMACDVWKTVRENLRAVGLAVEAIRTLERTGASEIMGRAFTGFAALPGASEWWLQELELGCDFLGQHPDPDAALEALNRAYRRLALERHPDRGGSHEQMRRLNAAKDEAMRAIQTA